MRTVLPLSIALLSIFMVIGIENNRPDDAVITLPDEFPDTMSNEDLWSFIDMPTKSHFAGNRAQQWN